MKARFLLAYIILLLTCANSSAQVFHYKTGQVVSSSQPGTIIWKDGVFDGYPASYGTLVSAETNKRNARLLTIPVIHIKAIEPDSNASPIFILNGGPGETNLRKELIFEPLLNHHDLVLVGYRGVDGSVQLECNALKSELQNPALTKSNCDSLLSAAIFSCIGHWEEQQIDIEGYTIPYVLNDIYSVMKALGEEQISFLSFSYGTMLAQAFEIEFPDHLNQSVMIGARPLGDFVFNDSIFKEQINCATNDSLFYQRLTHLVDEQTQWNHLLFTNFLFGSMYTYQGILNLEALLNDYDKGIKEPFEDAFNAFDKMYPSELLLGDVWLKKQGYVDILQLDKTKSISAAMNSWYNIQPNYVVDYSKSNKTGGRANKLLINGAYDIASPPELCPKDSSCIKLKPIQNCGHLDFFINEKLNPEIQPLIIKFID